MITVLEKRAVQKAALPLTVEQYHRLCAAGIIPQNTELLRGVIIQKMGKSPQHTWLVQWLVSWIRHRLPQGLHARQEQPITLMDSEPEPDIAVVAGAPEDYRSSHPNNAQLVVEVAISSEELDRAKAEAYAAAGVTEYWLILAPQRRIEVYTEPSATGFQKSLVREVNDVLKPQCCPGAELSLRELFG